LRDVVLSGKPDRRTMMDRACFSRRNAYASLSTQLRDDYLEFVWKSFVPQNVKIFGWLLALDRLNIRGNLHHKTIIDISVFPHCDHPEGLWNSNCIDDWFGDYNEPLGLFI
jgi:hypothetical protein